MNKYIMIAADSIESLRHQDVYRVLEWADKSARAALAQYIKTERPDLAEEVGDCVESLT